MGHSSTLQLAGVPRQSPRRLPDLVLRLLVPGTEHANGKGEECNTLPLQPRLVSPELSVVSEFDGVSRRGCTVLDVSLLAGVDGHQVKARVAAAGPGPGEAVRRFETGIIARQEVPGLAVRLHAGRNQGVIEDVA